MGLGSKNEHTRKVFRNEVAHSKRDWKGDVKAPADAVKYLEELDKVLGADPNGEYLSNAYMSQKIKLLRRYVAATTGLAAPPSLKDWDRGERS